VQGMCGEKHNLGSVCTLALSFVACSTLTPFSDDNGSRERKPYGTSYTLK